MYYTILCFRLPSIRGANFKNYLDRSLVTQHKPAMRQLLSQINKLLVGNDTKILSNKIQLKFLLQRKTVDKNKTRGCSWNKFMKVYNGNIRQLQILHQNIPGKIIKDEDVGIHIDTIIDIYKPHMLFLSEVESDLVKLHCPENYTHVPGKQLNSTKLRMSCLILNNIQFTALDITCETPMVSVVIDGWTCVGLYREWRKCGHKNTDSIEQQTSKLNDLLKTLKKIKGNKVFVGDFNINLLFADMCHYKRLEPLEQTLQDFMLDLGMMQLVKSST